MAKSLSKIEPVFTKFPDFYLSTWVHKAEDFFPPVMISVIHLPANGFLVTPSSASMSVQVRLLLLTVWWRIQTAAGPRYSRRKWAALILPRFFLSKIGPWQARPPFPTPHPHPPPAAPPRGSETPVEKHYRPSSARRTSGAFLALPLSPSSVSFFVLVPNLFVSCCCCSENNPRRLFRWCGARLVRAAAACSPLHKFSMTSHF